METVLFCIISLCMLLNAVFVESAPETALVTHLPGFNGTFHSKHYSGYVTLKGKPPKNLFYYFVVSERNPTKDPVVLWLNGGPGCSSFDGFVYEHGPFNFQAGKSRNSLPTLHLNHYSWSKVSSVIYLDSPVGAGFSYSKNTTAYTTGDKQTASDTHRFLLKWFKEYPEFLPNPFYISGESYAGVYVPTLASRLVKGIKAGAKPVIDLKGYLIGNGVTDYKFDGNALVPFAHGMGLISDDIYEETKSACGGIYYNDDESNCSMKLMKVYSALDGLNLYDILEPCYLMRFKMVQPIGPTLPVHFSNNFSDMIELHHLVSELSILGLMAEGIRSSDLRREITDLVKESEERHESSIKRLESLIEQLGSQLQGALSKEGDGASSSQSDASVDQRAHVIDKPPIPSAYNSHHKLKIPKFDGEDFRGWLMEVECYFEIEETPAHLKIKMATSQLSGQALQWHEGYVKTHGFAAYLDWDFYVQNMRSGFGASVYDDPLPDNIDDVDVLYSSAEIQEHPAESSQSPTCVISQEHESDTIEVKVFEEIPEQALCVVIQPTDLNLDKGIIEIFTRDVSIDFDLGLHEMNVRKNVVLCLMEKKIEEVSAWFSDVKGSDWIVRFLGWKGGTTVTCARLGELKLVSDISVTNSLISMYSKCEVVDVDANIFKNTLVRTLDSWNASDGLDDQLVESPSSIRFLIKLLKPVTSAATEIKTQNIGSELLALQRDSDTSKAPDSNSTAIPDKVLEILVSFKDMKPHDVSNHGAELPELNPKWIALRAMEKACLSKIYFEDMTGTVRKAGGNFKEKFLDLGGFDVVFEVAMNCHLVMESWLERYSTAQDAKDGVKLQCLVLLLKCLNIMENATFLSKDSQSHLLGMKGSLNGCRLFCTKLVIRVIKILSGLQLLQQNSLNSIGGKQCSLHNGSEHGLDLALIADFKDKTNVVSISSSSGHIEEMSFHMTSFAASLLSLVGILSIIFLFVMEERKGSYIRVREVGVYRVNRVPNRLSFSESKSATMGYLAPGAEFELLVNVFTMLMDMCAKGGDIGTARVILDCMANRNVTYDSWSLLINGERKLLISVVIHCPRSVPRMWPGLVQTAKQGEVDTIETYIFWNGHEPSPNNYYFEGRYDLVKIAKIVQQAGMYLILCIGPFVAAEWNFGEIPVWLHYISGTVFRNDNENFKYYMKKFTTYIVDLMNQEKLFASQGGPIMLAQDENEYSFYEGAYGKRGKKNAKWTAEMVVAQNIDKPKMWTENWLGWFRTFGEPNPHRPPEDVAYFVACFFRKVVVCTITTCITVAQKGRSPAEGLALDIPLRFPNFLEDKEFQAGENDAIQNGPAHRSNTSSPFQQQLQ